MIRLCYALIPSLFGLLGAFLLHFYKLDKMKPEITAGLEAKRAAQQ